MTLNFGQNYVYHHDSDQNLVGHILNIFLIANYLATLKHFDITSQHV